jgi:hypothetical protein
VTNLLGDSKFLNFMAYGLLLVIGLAIVFWLYRLFFGPRIRGLSPGRSRQPRLGVVDSYDLDAKRQLVLIRRDNTEHLIMIGGPNDVLIESALTRNHPAVQASGATGLQTGARDLLAGLPEASFVAPQGLAAPPIAASPIPASPIAAPPLMANPRLADPEPDPPALPPQITPQAPVVPTAKAPSPPIKTMPSAIPSAPIPPRMPPMTRPVTSPSVSAKPITPKPLVSTSASSAPPASSKVEASKPDLSKSPVSAPVSPKPSSSQTGAAKDEAIDALEQEMARLLNRSPGESR